MDDIGLGRVAIVHIGHVTDIHHRTIHHPDRQLAQLLDGRGCVVQPHRVFQAANLLVADRQNQVLRRQRVGDVLRRQAARVQRLHLEVDLDQPLLAPIGKGNGRARHGHQRRAHRVDPQVKQRLLRHALPRHRELQDRHRRRVVIEDQRRRDAGRHLAHHHLGYGGDLGIGHGNVDARLEKNLDDANAGIGIGLDMLDVVDGGGQRALVQRTDTSGHLLRRQAGVLPGHRNHRYPDFRKDVRGGSQRRQGPDDHQQQGHHHEGIGPLQRYPYRADQHGKVFSSGP